MISVIRQKRGEIDSCYTMVYETCSDRQLISMLTDNDAQQRSVAATLLGERGVTECIAALCEQLSKEKSLYSKIAMSNSLARFGTTAISYLEKYIGKINKNQHERLPSDLFRKKNYPLPRDIVIRTIIRMEAPALHYLQDLLTHDDTSMVSEIIDAIGYLTFYTKDYCALNDVLVLFDKSEQWELIRWKLIRAFQGFPQVEVIRRLEAVLLESKIPAHRWEAVRSLVQINTVETRRIAGMGLNDSHPLVVEMVNVAMKF